MRQERKLFSWLEIGSVPSGPGIYAWYYRHLLTDHDIDRLTAEVVAAGGDQEAPSDWCETSLVPSFSTCSEKSRTR